MLEVRLGTVYVRFRGASVVWWWAWLVRAATGDTGLGDTGALSPEPPALVAEAEVWVGGEAQALRLVGGPPNAVVRLFASSKGLDPAPDCTTHPPACAELLAPKLLGQARTDASGEIARVVTPPLGTRDAWLQAVVDDAGALVGTAPLHRRVVDPTTDPVVLSLSVPLRPGLRDLVAVAATSDPQGDPVSLTWSWTVDGAPTAHTTDRVPATDLWPGQVWSVEAVPSDGSHLGLPAVAEATIPEPPGGNVIVVLLDDLGVDKVGLYDPAVPAAPTPTLDALAAQGVVFDNAYASPVCSPSRANLMTGRYGRRTGWGGNLKDAEQLSSAEVLIPELLQAARGPGPWTSVALGKWALAGPTAPRSHPNDEGFSWYSGNFEFFNELTSPFNTYFDWLETTNGVEVGRSTVYNTTDIVDDAIAQLAILPEPFFLYVAFNATHNPLVPPPSELDMVGVTDVSPDGDLHRATLAAVDAELARLLAAIPPDIAANTTVVVTADNGTQNNAIEAPYNPVRSKNSVFEGGVHVPMVVTGPHVGVPGSRSGALVHLVDVYTTLADLAGVPLVDTEDEVVSALALGDGSLRSVDGVGLLDVLADPDAPFPRTELFVEKFTPNGPPPYDLDYVSLRDASHKLLRLDGQELLYELVPGAVDEGISLLADGTSPEEQAILDRLSEALDARLAAMPYEGF